MRESEPIDEMVGKLLTGDRRAASRLISLVENEPHRCDEVMKQIYPHTGRAMVLGITGPGGAGKSTLTDHIILGFRREGKTVGAILVDPSSPFSGGAFLGDRIRLGKHALDEGVFVRSMASRGHLGGLARATYDAIRIIEAMGVDVVIVETLGVGQDEIEVIQAVQTCLLVVTPSMGDYVQAMKAGILEIADIIALNKSDLEDADACRGALERSLKLASVDEDGWMPPLISTVGVSGKSHNVCGIDELMAGISAHTKYLHESGAIDRVRSRRVEREIGLVFRDQLENCVLAALNESGKRKEYIKSVLDGTSDPYSVVEEVLECLLDRGGETTAG